MNQSSLDGAETELTDWWIMCNVVTRLLLMVNGGRVLPIAESVESVHCGYNVVTEWWLTPARVCLNTSDFLDIKLAIIIIIHVITENTIHQGINSK